MEEAGYTSDPKWNRPNRLWGRFDIHSVYVARGSNWEPLVTDGRLDLRYNASPIQWAEGLTFGLESGNRFSHPTRLTWLTPFDLEESSHGKSNASPPRRTGKEASVEAPTLRRILEALKSRINLLTPGPRNTPDSVWDILPAEVQSSIQDAMEQADNISILHKSFSSAPRSCPGRWIGTQILSHIPPPIIPYLELASIVHIGSQTHFGCGTFALVQSTSDIA